MRNEHIGSSFDAFLEEEGILEETEAVAIKRVLAWQLKNEMKKQHVSQSEMARRMHTSRAHVSRLLDPKNVNVQLETLQRAAATLGQRILMSLVDERCAVKLSAVTNGICSMARSNIHFLQFGNAGVSQYVRA